ncbi:GNAT family N-acetyltransferase [Bacteroidota bacterium]
MSSKKKYRQLCKQEKSIPIFSQDWWLDTVCGENNWDVALVENNGEIKACLPYHFKSKFGFNMFLQPILTQQLIIWLDYPAEKLSHQKTSIFHKSINELITNLPKFKYFSLCFNYEFINWMPFYWNGFKQTTRYTYVIENTKNLELIYNNFSKSLKQDLRKAENLAEVYKGLDLETFYKLNCFSFSKQKLKNPISYELLKKIDNQCLKRNCREIIYTKDKQGKVHSAMYIVWDNEYVYCLLGGTDPKYRKSRSKNLINLEAIKIAHEKKLKFNFEGSMLENVEYFYRQYNCELIPYFQIEKVNSPLLKTYFFLKDLF